MSWLLLGLAVPVFVAFLTRRATRKEVVSSLAIFEVLAAEVEPRRRFAVPHHLLALVLTLLALVAGTLALAGVGGEDRDVVIVLDRSASMGAADGRWEAALEALDHHADRSAGERVALVSEGLIEPYGPDGGRLVERARAWTPEGSDRSGEDLRIARRLEPDAVLWITDGVGTVAPPEGVQVVRVGGPLDNLGVADLALRPLDGLGGQELQLVVANGTAEPRAVDLELEVDGLLVDTLGFEVPAHGEASRTLRGTWQGSLLGVRLPGGDGLAADDHVQVSLAPAEPVPVVLRSERPRSFLAEALSVHPRVDLRRCGADIPCDPAPLAFVEGALELPDAATVVVFDGTDGTLQDPAILRWAFEDPVFRFVDLQRLGVAGARLVEGEPLITVEQGAIAARDGHVLRFGFDLEQTDLPVRLAFLNLVANLVDEAAPHQVSPPTGLLDGAESAMTPRDLGGAEAAEAAPNWTRALLALALLLLVLETALPALRRWREARVRRRLGTSVPEETRLAG